MPPVLLIAAEPTNSAPPAVAPLSPQGSVVTPLSDLELGTGNDPRIARLVENALTSPDTFNGLARALKDHLVAEGADTNSYFQFIKDLNLNFKVFDAQAAGGEAALGFDYSFERSIVGRTLRPGSDNPLGLSFAAHARGNVAFDKSKNPDDFLETGLKLHLFQSLGGWEPEIRQKIPAAGEKTEAQKLIDDLDLNLSEEERSKDPKWQSFLRFIDQRSRMQLFWDVAGHASLESNQSFAKKQAAYGLQAGALARAWNPSSPWARWNLLDFPFAAIRFLTHADEDWAPSGQALPSLLAGVDLVDPTRDPSRLAANGNRDSYPRFRAEVAFKTRVTRVAQQNLWLALSYRHYQELGPSPAIRRAGLDQSDSFVAVLDLVHGLNVSYTVGRLPLDRESDRVFALGWKVNF